MKSCERGGRASHFGFDVPLFARLVKLFIEVGAVVCGATNSYMRLASYVHDKVIGTWSKEGGGCVLEIASLARRLKQPAVFPNLPLGLFK